MAQADSQNTTADGGANALPVSSVKSSQTRRGILRALAAAPVVALVPAIPVLASARYGSDAFATLGTRLQEQWKAFALNRPIYEETHDKANELFYEALIRGPVELDINEDTDGSEYWATIRRTHSETGFDKAEKVDERTRDALYETVKQIERLKPATIGDLAVIANVCAYSNPDLWESPVEALDWHEQYFRTLVDEVLRLAGAKLILEGLPIPQTVDQSAHQRAHEFWKGKAGARLPESRKNDIFNAFIDSMDEIGSPKGVAPEVLRERTLKAINSRLSCTDRELSLMVDWADPMMKAAMKRPV